MPHCVFHKAYFTIVLSLPIPEVSARLNSLHAQDRRFTRQDRVAPGKSWCKLAWWQKLRAENCFSITFRKVELLNNRKQMLRPELLRIAWPTWFVPQEPAATP